MNCFWGEKMKDKVDILLSVYNPNEKYLRQQLESLDRQTYENIEIIVFDDCIDKRCDENIFVECIKNKTYRILPYKENNLGYTKAFEYLVKESTGEYVAFCDQDDIWDEYKIEKCVDCLKRENTILVTTDRKIIDENGNIVIESVRAISKKNYDTWKSYDDIGKYNFFTTYTVGMSMVIEGNFLRKTVPFSVYTGHDKWVTACACACGQVSYLEEPLVSYRRHGNNVSGVLRGVSSKKEYEEERIIPHLKLIEEFKERYPEYKGTKEALEFAYARKNHDIAKLFKYRYLAPDLAKFEILLALVPNFVMKIVIKLLQRAI